MSATKLYRHFAEDGTLLYVGVTRDISVRQSAHLSSSRWGDKIARIDIETHPSRTEALAAERAAILAERPLYNIQRTGGTRDSGHTIMMSIRMPQVLLMELDRIAFESKITRSGLILEMLEDAVESKKCSSEFEG